ncbi:RagB/SusD family nutrient uptake outer membrane protein [Rhodocytophaga rosea]|uniref:RagB/SusD family nutrient uptake outer membrane protein n=1 Tax=Rhodocytophaga rosea TaxID=2704465 RepID=A0A6C0GPL9_9BACT|nr:RagB/SusD family nutrient uptake outer membrane protein [Rhodocytophaga rosea]QHT69996.1 RagB/SusD family nutrient uptake outer membrane protein [Rhodocytophaga rosea]
MRKYITIVTISLLTLIWGCNDDKFLDRQPTNILLNDQVWKDDGLVLSVLADLYGRFPDYQNISNWERFADFDEAFASAFGEYGRHRNQDYDYASWNYWDYGYLREINLFIQKCEAATELPSRDRFLAEARFLRAGLYFEMVKSMGGVPLILEPLTYDFSGDPTYLRTPRSKEHEIYDFVISEMEAIKSVLPDDGNIKSRATKGTALAMKTRAALYAGAIAKYGTTTPQVSLAGGEAGIPASMAASYYQTALTAAQEIIAGGKYALYNKKPDLGENFASIFYDKNNNSEVIFARDFKLKSGSVHNFTIVNQPRYQSEEQEGGRINPSLNLVQSFEKIDNTYAPFATTDGAGNPIYYDNLTDIFASRDARLYGTVILPGTQFKGKDVEIWAGYQLADGGILTADQFGGRKTLPGKTADEQVVGFSGPIDNLEFSAQTGFYIRKHMDPQPGSGQRGVQSDVWWIRYRYAEVLLNAAEAAFELGQAGVAAQYMNEVRARAGLTIPLAAGDITFDRMVHERKVEFAFEGHQLWDMKRWRLAHVVWNGASMDINNLKSNIGDAEKTSTMPFGLWPYKVYNPGSPNHGKWVFKEIKPSQATNADRFRLGNYYSRIDDGIVNNNPLIVRNPNQ